MPWKSPATPRRADKRTTGMAPVTAAILEKSPAPKTLHAKAWAKLMAQVGEEFPLLCPFLRRRYSAHLLATQVATQVDTQVALQTAGAVSLRTEGSQVRRRPGWLRPREVRFSHISARRSNLRPLSPARAPPSNWGELGQVHKDVEIVQIAPDFTARDRHSLVRAARVPPPQSGTRRRAAPTVKKLLTQRWWGEF